MNKKAIYIITTLIAGISVFGSFSVIGILQSTERVSSSGLIVQPMPPPPLPPPPEPSIDIECFSDSQCLNLISNVEWGDINVGGSVSRMVWVKNSGEADTYLTLTTENWNPTNAGDYLSLDWDYNGNPLEPDSIRQIVLTLNVSPSIQGINAFYFDIVFVASVQ